MSSDKRDQKGGLRLTVPPQIGLSVPVTTPGAVVSPASPLAPLAPLNGIVPRRLQKAGWITPFIGSPVIGAPTMYQKPTAFGSEVGTVTVGSNQGMSAFSPGGLLASAGPTIYSATSVVSPIVSPMSPAPFDLGPGGKKSVPLGYGYSIPSTFLQMVNGVPQIRIPRDKAKLNRLREILVTLDLAGTGVLSDDKITELRREITKEVVGRDPDTWHSLETGKPVTTPPAASSARGSGGAPSARGGTAATSARGAGSGTAPKLTMAGGAYRLAEDAGLSAFSDEQLQLGGGSINYPVTAAGLDIKKVGALVLVAFKPNSDSKPINDAFVLVKQAGDNDYKLPSMDVTNSIATADLPAEVGKMITEATGGAITLNKPDLISVVHDHVNRTKSDGTSAPTDVTRILGTGLAASNIDEVKKLAEAVSAKGYSLLQIKDFAQDWNGLQVGQVYGAAQKNFVTLATVLTGGLAMAGVQIPVVANLGATSPNPNVPRFPPAKVTAMVTLYQLLSRGATSHVDQLLRVGRDYGRIGSDDKGTYAHQEYDP